MDKFFIFFALVVLCIEQRLSFWQIGALISRDLFLLLFGLYLVCSLNWKRYRLRSAWWGKVTTCAQFLLLILLTFQVVLPAYIFSAFVVLGILVFGELFFRLSAARSSRT